jgi:hypothetical protein
MTDEKQEFWDEKEGGSITPKKEDEMMEAEELSGDDMGAMKIKVPKPLYEQPTKVKITGAKFLKVDEEVFDRNQKPYKAFFITLNFQDPSNGVEFQESYRGGRIYVQEDGSVSTYIGPNSALGQLKAKCIENNISIGNNIKEWAASMIGKEATMKMTEIAFQGKTWKKNLIISLK